MQNLIKLLQEQSDLRLYYLLKHTLSVFIFVGTNFSTLDMFTDVNKHIQK